jgi:predicted transcriptional regulator of viral defense system
MERVWELAERQYGVVARWQLDQSEAHRVDKQIRRGRLERVEYSVYRIRGAPASWKQELMICMLAAGPGSAASLWASAALLGVPGFRRSRIAVTRLWKRGRERKPEWLHESTYLPESHITVVEGIRCVRVDRTLFDLCGVLSKKRAKRMLKTALSRGMTTYGRLEKVFFETARRGRKGSALMREFLD